ncbi:hypothetical protein BDN67DRAFT_664806 [Paxillus ammoniavirescens]|nr:hypothetical protein BDN67DRAFT_664806 [Paxillus ammoniavirescens]
MHNGTVLMLEGDQTHSGHFEIPSTSRHGDVPVSGNSYNRLHFSSDPNRPESTYRRHWRDNHAPNTHSTAFSFAKEDRSRGEHRFDEISYPGSTSITRSTASGSTMYSYNGVNVAAPFPEKALPPAPTGVAPIFQSSLLPFDPLQPSGPSWPPYAEWGLQGSPPNPIVQYPNHGISLNPHGTGSVISALNPATISNTNQRREHTYQPGPFLHPGSGASSYDTAVQNKVAVSVPVLVDRPLATL